MLDVWSFFQVTRLQRAAESRFDSILSSVRQSKGASAPSTPTSSGPADLRERLEAAINVLQDGLIERDTEVGIASPYWACMLPGSFDIGSRQCVLDTDKGESAADTHPVHGRSGCCCLQHSLGSTYCSLARQARRRVSWGAVWLAYTRAHSLRGCSRASPSQRCAATAWLTSGEPRSPVAEDYGVQLWCHAFACTM